MRHSGLQPPCHDGEGIPHRGYLSPGGWTTSARARAIFGGVTVSWKFFQEMERERDFFTRLCLMLHLCS